MPWLRFKRNWTWRPAQFRGRWMRAFKAGTVTLQPRSCAAAALAAGAAEEIDMQAGRLRERVTFSARTELSGDGDGYGNFETGWVDQFTVAADIVAKLGREDVQAQRLQGHQPIAIVVRASSETRQVTTDWRVTDARSGVSYNIRSIAPDRLGAKIELMCEAGVADG